MDIKKSPSGKVVKLSTGYNAFVPNVLPPQIEWNTSLITALSRADHLLGKLAQEGNKLPNPFLLMRPFIAREAVLSSKIEGTQATLGEILAEEAGSTTDRAPDDLQEVKNYIEALDYGMKRLDKLPLSLRLLREIHSHLMKGVRGAHATPGEFRHTQNWIGTPGCTLTTAKYVPPPPEELMKALCDFESFLHDQTLPPLVHIALCHYQFEAIHPFLDGNGRVGRLLIPLLLIQRKILPIPILYLSAFFEATRYEYYRQLLNLSSHGTWNDWLTYFINGVALQTEDVLSRAERINQIIMKWKITVGGDASGILQQMITHFAKNPYFTAKVGMKKFDCAFSTIQRAIMKLEKWKMISKISTGKRDRVYCAQEILAILEEPTKLK
ncbi:MAG: Fic family protein [Chthoniobacterales bacterium]|nr:Fic family protein [Chthoniobacterales bacterium]